MAITSRLNRNMGSNQMTKEEEHRYLVLVTTISQDHFVSLFRGAHDYGVKYRAWLCLMGLMETYDVIKMWRQK